MTCRLCALEKGLRNSHIIPEFLYKPLYDDKHRAQRLFNTDDKPEYKRLRPLQKGLREKLLCSDCEQLLNDRYEKYFKKRWFDEKALPRKLNDGVTWKVRNLDYHKFKLFHLSVLFRASVSSLPEYQQVTLGPHEENIRKIIFNNTSCSDREYVILCHAITKSNSEIQYGLITNPFKLRQPTRHISYGFCFGGCIWYYIVDSRAISEYSSFMLNSKGDLCIMPISWEHFLGL